MSRFILKHTSIKLNMNNKSKNWTLTIFNNIWVKTELVYPDVTVINREFNDTRCGKAYKRTVLEKTDFENFGIDCALKIVPTTEHGQNFKNKWPGACDARLRNKFRKGTFFRTLWIYTGFPHSSTVWHHSVEPLFRRAFKAELESVEGCTERS